MEAGHSLYSLNVVLFLFFYVRNDPLHFSLLK